jgi:hypothetical protein
MRFIREYCGMIGGMLRVSGILFDLLTNMLRWLRLTFRSRQSIQAENLFLRRQLALYIERGVKPVLSGNPVEVDYAASR